LLPPSKWYKIPPATTMNDPLSDQPTNQPANQPVNPVANQGIQEERVNLKLGRLG